MSLGIKPQNAAILKDPIVYEESSGKVQSRDIQSNTVYLMKDRFEALTPLTVNPDSIILKEGKPISTRQIFINDRVIRVRYRRDTKEIRMMEIRRIGSPLYDTEANPTPNIPKPSPEPSPPEPVS